jgi:DNA-binding NarL/FixJ family response regulator
MASPYRIVLADDHVMFRRGIRKILEGLGDVEVVGESGDGLELLRDLKTTNPDMIILDISMPRMQGLEAAKEIKGLDSRIKILLLSMHKEAEYLYQAFSAGAEGYLLKEDADVDLLKAINTLRNGGIYVSRLLFPQLTNFFLDRYRTFAAPRSSAEKLSAREREIFQLIAEGKSSKEISQMLCISNRTAQHHRANIMRKLNVKKTVDLVKYALQKGYVSAR